MTNETMISRLCTNPVSGFTYLLLCNYLPTTFLSPICRTGIVLKGDDIFLFTFPLTTVSVHFSRTVIGRPSWVKDGRVVSTL